mgnify:CR=1 FL=1
MEKRFRVLRLIAIVFKVLAWISLVGGILGGLVMLALMALGGGSTLGDLGAMASLMGGVIGGLMVFFMAVVASILSFIQLYAIGEAILLALAIEENTRETAYYLKGGTSPSRPL